jgi:diacylglycerol kinase family enzyme
MTPFYGGPFGDARLAILRLVDVHLLYNPRSGSGRARALASRFESALGRSGIPVHPHPTHQSDGSLTNPIDPARIQGSVLAVIGGDGTIHRAAPLAAKAGAAIYHIPAGTENLFARHFGMTAEPADLVRALKTPRITPMDLATCNGHPFVIMASFGPDAGVIHRLHNTRQGPIRHWSYVRPIFGELFEPHLPKITVRIDGTPWLDTQRGMLIVANSPRYALGLNPARGARVDDGLLDAVFYPCESVVDLAVWASRLFLNRNLLPVGALSRQGTIFEITSADDEPLHQMDGEVPADQHQNNRNITLNRYDIRTQPGALRVLNPVIL